MKCLAGVIVVLLLVLQVFSFGSPNDDDEIVRYDFYRLYSVLPNNRNQVEVLDDMEMNSDSLIFLGRQRESAQIVVAPHKVADFEKVLKRSSTTFTLLSDNIQTIIEKEKNRAELLHARSDGFNWKEYQKLPEINEWLYQQQNLHPKVASVQVIGKTYEKREILAMKISRRSGNKAIFIEAGMHAREWISPAFATYFINELLNNKNSTEMMNLSSNYDWYFVVNANPDGYVHTEKNRMWRKNRNPYKSCYGTDPNRNFNISWAEKGSHPNPCHDTFPGEHAHSELEVQSLTNFVRTIPDLRLYLSMHSYSQLLLFPNGHTEEVPDNNEDLHEIAFDAVAALHKRYGTKYRFGNIYHAIYPASGSSIDWVVDKTATELAFCYELRPHYNDWKVGFSLPPEEIIPTGEETIDSIQAMIRSSTNLGYFD